MVRVWLVSGGYNLKPARALKQSNKNVRNGGIRYVSYHIWTYRLQF
jgi:hypothetical protein